MKKLFVVCYGGGHVKIIHKLYKELSNRFQVEILALTGAMSYLESNGVPYKTLKYYYGVLNDSIDVKQIGEQFVLENGIDCSIGAEQSFLYYGYCIRDYKDANKESDLSIDYKNYGRLVFLPMKTMSLILEYEKPDGVLVTNSPRFERATILAAREMNISSFSIEDLLGDSRIFSPYETEENKKYYGDYVFVLNDYVRNIFAGKQIAAKDIISTGHPGFEGIRKEIFNVDETKIRYGLEGYKRIILWASHESNEEKVILDDICKNARLLKDTAIVIKPHPNENYQFMAKKVDESKGHVVIIQNSNVRELIFISDLVMTQYSTCGLEAVMMDKPLVVINPFDQEYSTDYSKLGLAVKVKNINELEYIIRTQEISNKLLIEENIKKFKMPENCTNNIASYIDTILGGVKSE